MSSIRNKLPISDEEQLWLKLDHQLCFQLYVASKTMTQLYRPLLNKIGLTYPQYLVMLVLWESTANNATEMSVKHLGEKLYLDSGTLTPLLKRLEQQALITRQRSTEDERAVLIALTNKGIRLSKKAAAIPANLLCKIDSSLDELVGLKQQLEILNRKIQQPD